MSNSRITISVNPTSGLIVLEWGLSSSGRASGSQSEGGEFESRRLHFFFINPEHQKMKKPVTVCLSAHIICVELMPVLPTIMSMEEFEIRHCQERYNCIAVS